MEQLCENSGREKRPSYNHGRTYIYISYSSCLYSLFYLLPTPTTYMLISINFIHAPHTVYTDKQINNKQTWLCSFLWLSIWVFPYLILRFVQLIICLFSETRFVVCINFIFCALFDVILKHSYRYNSNLFIYFKIVILIIYFYINQNKV